MTTVYAIVSSEAFLRHEHAQKLRLQTVTTPSDFNCNDFCAGDVAVETVIQTLHTAPFLSERRFVLFNDCQKLKVNEQEQLLQYLIKPSAYNVLCLTFDKIDMRQKLAKQLQQLKALQILDPPNIQSLPQWLLKRSPYPIELSACQLLVEFLGQNLNSLLNAIEKAALYANNNLITSEHIVATTFPTELPNIFAFTDAFGERQLAKILPMAEQLLHEGENALGLLAMLCRHIRLLLKVKETPQMTAQQLGVPAFVINNLVKQTKNYSLVELKNSLTKATKLDWQLKSSTLDHPLLFTAWLVESMA